MTLLLLLALQSPPASPPPAEKPSLAGRWVFDPDRSDDVAAKIRAAEAAQQQANPGTSPYGSRHRSHSSGSQSPPKLSPGWQVLADPPRSLTITQTPTEITILDSGGRLLQLHPGSSPASGETATCSWKDQSLVVETREEGLRTTQALTIAADALTVTVTVYDQSARSVSAKRVYQHPAP
jgi:hypothetical protein